MIFIFLEYFNDAKKGKEFILSTAFLSADSNLYSTAILI